MRTTEYLPKKGSIKCDGTVLNAVRWSLREGLKDRMFNTRGGHWSLLNEIITHSCPHPVFHADAPSLSSSHFLVITSPFFFSPSFFFFSKEITNPSQVDSPSPCPHPQAHSLLRS